MKHYRYYNNYRLHFFLQNLALKVRYFNQVYLHVQYLHIIILALEHRVFFVLLKCLTSSSSIETLSVERHIRYITCLCNDDHDVATSTLQFSKLRANIIQAIRSNVAIKYNKHIFYTLRYRNHFTVFESCKNGICNIIS